MIILDTDIASAFAKVFAVELLVKNVDKNLLISKAVYEELQIPFEHGFDFPKEIFKFCEIIFLQKEEINLYLSLKNKYPLGKGELESITIAKARNIPFLSFDKKAINICLKENVRVITPASLFLFLKTKIGERVFKLVEEIEEKDNRDLSFVRKILT